MASGKPRGNSRRKSAGRKKGELLALASGATVLASWYAHAVAANPDKTPYDLSFWREGASIAGTALSTWLIHRRSPAAFPTAAATAFGTIALGAANVLKKGAYVTRTWNESSIKEKVCLQNSLFYSIIATWGVWQLLPALEKLMKKTGDTTLDGILVGMGSVFLFLELLYQAVPPKKKDDGNGEPDTTSDADKAEQSHIVDASVPGTGMLSLTRPSTRR